MITTVPFDLFETLITESNVPPTRASSLAVDLGLERNAYRSCEEGVAKPAPDIYLRALDRLDARADTTVYVGDGADNELAGAAHAGLRAYRAVWFIRSPSHAGAWLELGACADVLNVVSAG
jgi:FMN phosphatase YigB (HAD superfamily)